MWQANHVRDLLQAAHPDLQLSLVPLVTKGDRILDQPLAEIGGKGLFLKELEHAILARDADVAVHSLKDVPAELADGLALPVVLPRVNPADAWVSRDHRLPDELPAGAIVGTSSLRRQCQLRRLRPDLAVSDLRGNVDTRLNKLEQGQYDAVILAVAGLQRLGWSARISAELSAPDWLPAPGQGIIGIECRSDDDRVRRLLAPLNDPVTATCAAAERTLARVLQAGCQVPLGGLARISDQKLQLQALLGMDDGSRVVRAAAEGSPQKAEQLGFEVAQQLRGAAGGEMLAALGLPI